MAERSSFRYDYDLRNITIYFKGSSSAKISIQEFNFIIKELSGKTMNIGTSRTNPPKGSFGEWLIKNVSKSQLASYLGPILIEEGFAERTEDKYEIRIL